MSTAATLNDLRVTSASVNIPAYGCWFAKASVDGEHDIAKGSPVTLKIADATFSGTVLSGGPAKGRSAFRIVAGAGGWGRTLKKHEPYANDAGVKVATVLGDAAREAGETLAPIDPSLRVGPAWARPEGPGSRVLEQIAPGAWYVDEAGTTRLGKRAPGTLPAGVTHGPVDRARGTVTLASEQIATILPGIVVDGLVVVDVLHEVSAKDGLRSTVWGALGGGSSRDLETLRRLLEQLDPLRRFRGVTEYRIESREGKRLNLQAVKISLGMPDLARVPVRPGVAGCDGELEEGAHVLVGFANSEPSGAFVMCGADLEDDLFQPSTLNLLAGGQLGGEHVATVEATALLVYNALATLLANPALVGPLTASALLPLLGPSLLAAITAQASPAPADATGQTAAAAAQLASFVAGAPATTSSYFKSAIDAVSNKTPNVTGLFPSLGAAAVEAG